MKKFLTMWQVWALIAVVLAIMLFQKQSNLSALLPFAIFLLCPLMMLFMMKDHHKR